MIQVSYSCNNCIHWESNKSVGTCKLSQKITHRLEGCKEWKGDKSNINGILSYLKTKGIERKYKQNGVNNYKIKYLSKNNVKQKNKNKKTDFKETYYVSNYKNLIVKFSRSCETCSYSKGEKALKFCKLQNKKIHKYESCPKWEADEEAIKRFRASKKRLTNKKE